MRQAYNGILTAALLMSIGAALLLGSTYLSPTALLQGQADVWQMLINYRLPRVIVAILGGAMIGMSSILLQLVLRNRLVDASIIGIMNGSQFLTMCLIVLLPILTKANVLISGIFGIGLLFIWRMYTPKQSSALRLILVGIATAMTFQSLTQLTTDGFGVPLPSLSTVTWSQVGQLFVLLLLGLIVLIMIWPNLKYFALSTEQLRLLNIPEHKLVYLVLGIVGLWSGVVTSLLGVVFFFGAILPQLSRTFFPDAKAQSLLIPTSLWGSLLLLNADTLARTVMAPTELPASAVLLAISGPLFIVLLMKRGS
ncbi:FecCD family ABC transporter permease [Weissella tructae]|uniref:Iron (Fe) ABC superfamily ATP binding cassette transporter, membrane protein n=2 Tax=Weissella TaxID=46255 RepID=A0A075U0A0_9LACO|nr:MULTISPECIES: iron chelate uptake ABC transporter family permease subunit [Weissella]AIG65916.1 Iron (Fe) ABC superfamily ATP binding cassette transporter, membrane protein [Weissella tructae]AIM63294.1 Iron (Fe) ABC superfamily ATP binding cassette transporter, membrane protein [Weissella ceti]AIM64629.1 Iron (Fe) ABC superfamily ATP binding cassette transporter, membrane protein [Weissella ceti]ELA07287.1 ABC-type Fe3+-siderophore transport system, permease component [Weissella ceti NC36]